MAKRKSGAGHAAARPSDVPAPPADLAKLVNMMTWPKGQVIHRIHLKIYGSSEFNPGLKGNARFSPIKLSDGASIPTLYGGATFDCAAMETVFHDVPFAAGLKTLDKQKLADQVYSQVTPKRNLSLADLVSNFADRMLRAIAVSAFRGRSVPEVSRRRARTTMDYCACDGQENEGISRFYGC